MEGLLLIPFLVQAPAAAPGMADVEAVVVTAERGERPRGETAAAISVVDRASLERRHIVVVSDALAQTPGVQVNRNGGVGAATSVRIRGAEAEQTAVLIDGVKLNDPASPGGGFDFGNLLAGDLARIEVLRGPQSVLWGSQAIGGVVNLLTERPRAGFSAMSSAEAGSRDTGYVRVAAGHGAGRSAVRLAAGAYTTAGVSAFRGGAEDDGFRSAHLSGRLDLSLREDVTLDLRAYRASSRTAIDGFAPPLFAFGDTAEIGEVDETVAYAGLGYRAGAVRHRLGFAFTAVERENTDPDATFPTTFASTGRNRRLEYQGVLDRGAWRAVFGVERERSDIAVFALERAARLDSAYLQLSGEAATGVVITVGVRRDEHDRFGGETTAQAGAAWRLGATVLRANWGRGFKAPSLFQLYSDFGNAQLRPETAAGVDFGAERRFGPVRVSATVFRRRTEDQVDFFSCFGAADPRCVTRPFGFYDNLGSTQAQGVEADAEVRPGRLTVTAAYTGLQAENRDTGRNLARRPRHTLHASADYRWPAGLSVGAGLQHVGRRFDDAASLFQLAPYTLVDLRAAYPLSDRIELYGRIENLTDEAYEQARLYGAPGRGGFVGLRARF